MEEPIAAAPAPDDGEDGSAGFGFGSTTGGAGAEDSSRTTLEQKPPPRRVLSRRRSSFSIVQPPATAAAATATAFLDASCSGNDSSGSSSSAATGAVSSTAVIVATSRLGQGASGVAFCVSNPIDGKTYVLKRIKLGATAAAAAKKTTTKKREAIVGAEDEALYYNEPRLHALVKHQNVVSYHYSWVEREDESGASALCILLERGDAELWSLLVRASDPAPARAADASASSSSGTPSATKPTTKPHHHPPLGVWQRLRMAYEMASAVAAVHAAGVVHRDVSPWNVFIAGGAVKLGDFGLAARLDLHSNQQLSGLRSPGCMPLDASALGSIFSAPELGSAGGYGHAVDVYSTGLCLFALLYRGCNSNPSSSSPCPTHHQLLDPDDLVDAITRIRRDLAMGIKPELLLPGVPDGFAPLLRRMVSVDPSLRSTAQAVKEAIRALLVVGAAACEDGGLSRDDSMVLLGERGEQGKQRKEGEAEEGIDGVPAIGMEEAIAPVSPPSASLHSSLHHQRPLSLGPLLPESGEEGAFQAREKETGRAQQQEGGGCVVM